ncbi:hypothetical protein NOCA1130138 [metagenome]|uniref:Glycosyltransferase 2-like domain-containing protein n=1 Tax=metagenome TaxID=256318 RepID=A0A2P2C6P0_9ZZZZ
MSVVVSVVMPVHNIDPRLLRSSVASVLALDERVELVVVDDGSDVAATMDELTSLTAAGGRVRVVRQSNAGVAAARNTGISHAVGTFVSFLDPDDQFLPRNVTVVLDDLETESRDLIVCSARGVSWDGTKVEHYRVGSDGPISARELLSDLLSLYRRGRVSSAFVLGVPWAKFVRRSFLTENSLYFDDTLVKRSDAEWMIRVLRKCEAAQVHDVSVVDYRMDVPGNISRRFRRDVPASLTHIGRRAAAIDEVRPSTRQLYQLELVKDAVNTFFTHPDATGGDAGRSAYSAFRAQFDVPWSLLLGGHLRGAGAPRLAFFVAIAAGWYWPVGVLRTWKRVRQRGRDLRELPLLARLRGSSGAIEAASVRTRVMLSEPMPHQNAFIDLLAASVPDPFEVVGFDWRRAIVGRFQIFHLQWPEALFRSERTSRRAVKAVLVLALGARLRTRRIKVAWTVHNLAPHEELTWYENKLFTWLTSAVDRKVYLSPHPDDPTGQIVPHGHYRDRYAVSNAPRSSHPVEVLYFGNVRPYKGLEALIHAFKGLPSSRAVLRVCGHPVSSEYGQELLELTGTTQNIVMDLDFVDHADVPDLFAVSTLVVLPYTQIYNSGVLMLGLSLGRPVLVRESPATRIVAEAIGGDWVQLFDGELTPDLLDAALNRAELIDAGSSPDLAAFEWSAIGRSYATVYRSVLAGEAAAPAVEAADTPASPVPGMDGEQRASSDETGLGQ